MVGKYSRIFGSSFFDPEFQLFMLRFVGMQVVQFVEQYINRQFKISFQEGR